MAFVIEQDTFNAPDEYTEQYVGFRLPFSFGKIDSVLHDNTIDSVTDNLENLFNTEPGERIFHPNLGVSFKRLLFEQIDFDENDFQAVVQEQIEMQVKKWMPFLNVSGVNITKQQDSNQYTIKVDFHFKNNAKVASSVEISTAGAY